MEREYNEKMIKKYIKEPKIIPGKSTLKEEKLTFNITYYPVFQNIRNILQELHLLVTPDKESKMVFSNVPVEVFRNGKSLKDCLFSSVA